MGGESVRIAIEGSPSDLFPACFTAAGIIVLTIGELTKKAWLCYVATGLCLFGWILSIYSLVS